MTKTAIIEKVRKIEADLQRLKAELYLSLPKKEKQLLSLYREADILAEIRKIRKKLWNGKYSKAAWSIFRYERDIERA